MQDWRDTTGKVEGEVVRQIEGAFEEMWAMAQDKNIIARTKRIKSYYPGEFFVTNAPYFKRRFLYYAIIKALGNAKKTIHLTTPYFIPDRRLIRAMKSAVRRGVEVKVIVPEKIDVPVVASASYSSFSELLKVGSGFSNFSLPSCTPRRQWWMGSGLHTVASI